jgi:hypothetical protein
VIGVGLIYNILAFPVRGPIQGAIWIAQQVAQEADRELYDEQKIRAELAELEMRCDLGEISEEEYADAEEALLERLRMAQEIAAGTNEEAEE